mgnify:CR=1 FL=1
MPVVFLAVFTWCFAFSSGLVGGVPPVPESARATIPPGIVERVRALRAEVAYHDDLYFKQAAPEISDYDYDRLKAELGRLEAAYPNITDVGAGTRLPAAIGDDRDDSWPKARHRVRMGSLDKVFTADELAGFHGTVVEAVGHEDVVYSVEPKFDGVAISLTYEAGRLVRAVTRGNGEEGDDVTPNVRLISGVRPRLRGEDWPDVVELRGEIHLRAADFAQINVRQREAGLAPFANPRNLAAGTLKQHDPSVVTERGLTVVLFGWGAWEPAADRPTTLADFQTRLTGWGLPSVPRVREVKGLMAMQAAVGAWAHEREELPYPTDGVVVKLDRVAEQLVLGEGPAAPRWAVAYKFAPNRATTRLTGVEWQVGRSGVLTPVAEFEPVNLAGSQVARATLHHAVRFAAWDFHEGDVIVVEKAGDIIPAVVEVDRLQRVAGAVAYDVPERCPSCGVALWREEDGVDVVCRNAACPGQRVRRLVHFASRAGMNIDGLGPALAERLVAEGLVRGPPDLYRLTAAALVPLPGVGPASAARLLDEIAMSRERNLSAVIVALGMPGVGPVTAAEMAVRVGSLANLAEAEEIEPVYRGWARELVALGVARRSLPADDTAPSRGPFAGDVVVFTGGLATWTRAEAGQRVAAAGGVVESRLTARTTLVVAGANAGATLIRARERGVEVIDEAELKRRLGP